MPTTKRTNPPPKTEILSETREELTVEPQTSPNLGLADPSQSEVSALEEETQEQLQTEAEIEPGFTVDEEGEPTGDRLEDTQRAFHETREELSQLKKVLAAMVANTQAGGQTPAGGPPPIPPEMLSPEPTEEERLDPTKYVRRMIGISEMKRQYESTVQEMHNFVDTHSDWQDLYPTMMEIKNEEPLSFQGPGTLSRLYNRAKEREELKGYRDAMKDTSDKAFQAGVNTQRKKGPKPFVSPSGAGGMRTKATMPPGFTSWPTSKQKQWLEDHGFVKPDVY